MLKNLKRTIARALLDGYKRHKQKSFNPSPDHCLNTARAMLKQSKYCFLISNSARQWPSARMVQPVVDFDTFTIWLGTNPTLRKVKEIEKSPHVSLAFGNERHNANLIVYGRAEIICDKAERRRRWIGSWRLFFPDGPTGDDFVLIRVEPAEMELMNFKTNVVPEPFGLKPVKMFKTNGQWQVE